MDRHRIGIQVTGIILVIILMTAIGHAASPPAGGRDEAWAESLARQAIFLNDPALSAAVVNPDMPADVDKWAGLVRRHTIFELPKSSGAVPRLIAEDRGGQVWEIKIPSPGDGTTRRLAARFRDGSIQPVYLVAEGFQARPDATFQDACDYVVNQIAGSQPGTSEVRGWRSPVTAATSKLTTWHDRTVGAPWNDYWLFFIDDAPRANWAHPCRYVFVTKDLSAFAVQYALTPLSLRSTGANGSRKEESEVIVPFKPSAPAQARLAPDRGARSIRYTGEVARCYAVIISGGYDLDNNHIRYWGDAAFFYSTLTLKYGYIKSHAAIVIMADRSPKEQAKA